MPALDQTAIIQAVSETQVAAARALFRQYQVELGIDLSFQGGAEELAALRGEYAPPRGRPARWMLDEVYQSFENSDGNFLEQFQTTGFDARLFELYLFAYLTRTGYLVDRSNPRPDFIVARGDVPRRTTDG